MRGYFCIGFVNFMLKGKSLLDYINLFSPNKYEKNDNTEIFPLTKDLKWKKSIALFVLSIENLKILKYTFLKKTLVLFIICSKCKNEDSIEILKILSLIENILLL